MIKIDFTFHYVSINTGSREPRMVILLTLHSTMFLLIHHLLLIWYIILKLYIPLCFY